MTDPEKVEYLYGIKPPGYDANDDYQPARVIAFRITKKTPRRIYYLARDWGARPEVRFVDRQRIEADGEIWRRSAHWTAPDFHLHLERPVIEEARKPDLSELRAQMAAAHPDRGGTDAEFIAARERYERARAAA